MAVSIHGRILDERYTRLLMERTDLNLSQVMLLDQMQKGMRISREDHRDLKASGLVEGRYPNLMVAESIAKVTDDTDRYLIERGFDKQYYLDMILTLIREHGSVSRKEIDQALMSQLPDRLTEEQKRWRAQNLIQDLRRSGLIVNQGTRAQPAWMLSDTHQGRTFHT